MKKIAGYFAKISSPKIYHPYDKNNFIKTSDESFESTCFVLEQKGISNPGEMSIYSFISRIKIIEESISNKPKKI